MTIDDAIDAVLRNEGGYSNQSNDAGGETNFGITIKTARQQGYNGPMRDMPQSFAREVYKRQYVVAPGFDKIAAVSPMIAAELVDTGVNMGPDVPSRFLQRALNGLNNGGKDYPDLVVDGHVGPASVAALRAFLLRRNSEGERRLLLLLNALQGERYLSLAEGRVANESFLYGWLGRLS